MFHSGQRESTCCCWLQERWPKSDFSFTQLCNPHLMIFWQCEQHDSIFIFQIKPRPHSHVLLNQMRVCHARSALTAWQLKNCYTPADLSSIHIYFYKHSVLSVTPCLHTRLTVHSRLIAGAFKWQANVNNHAKKRSQISATNQKFVFFGHTL